MTTAAAREAVVVGGGLAGTAAALALADAGVRVTLLEGRPRLGGLAFSFQRGGLTVDNGQHVYLRCCTAYRWFLDRVDGAALAPVQDRLDVPVLDAGRGRLGRLRRNALPVPLHLGPSLARYPHLSLAEKAAVGRAALALRHLDPADPALDRQDFGSWLRRHGQSPRAVAALWDLVGVATLNAVADDASLALAAKVFRTGLLSDAGAADIGWAHVPLGELHHTRALTSLDKAGVRTVLRARVRGVTPGGEGARWQVETGDETLTADTVVLAVPPAAPSTSRRSSPGSAPPPSSTSTSSTTARSSGAPSSPPSTGRCSGSSTAPRRPGSTTASTSRSPSRPPRPRSTPPSPTCAPATCRSWSGCCPPPAPPASRTSSSPANAPRPSRRSPASAPCGPAPPPACPACTSPGHGPPPAGPPPWRAPYAAG